MGKRRQHSAEFKARVALEAAKGRKTVNEIAREYEVHPAQVSQWKKDLWFGSGSVWSARLGS